jgi:hypothetical protein
MVAIRNYPKNQRAGYPSLPGKNQGHTGDEHQHGRRQKLGNPVHDYEVNGFEIKTLHLTPPRDFSKPLLLKYAKLEFGRRAI